jgi:hypothetical protein
MKPIAIKDPSLKNLIDACQLYIDFVGSNRYDFYEADDYSNTVFEEAMKAIFGEKVFDWINMRI